jgi:hypothetical protein
MTEPGAAPSLHRRIVPLGRDLPVWGEDHDGLLTSTGEVSFLLAVPAPFSFAWLAVAMLRKG